MVRFKKGSPEAKAWGKRMKAMRVSKGSRNINKPVIVKASMAKRRNPFKKHRHAMKKHSIVTALGAGMTAYQAGKVGYGNYSWIDNVKENPTQPFMNLIGMGTGSFSLSNLVEVDAPVVVGYLTEKVLHKIGLDFKVSKRWKA